MLAKSLRYLRHLIAPLIGVGDIIIGKSIDNPVKTRHVKVSTKWWRDESQTQRYGGCVTG